MFRSTLMASALAALLAASYLGTAAVANAAGYKETDLVVGCDPTDPINQTPPKCFPATKTLIDANGNPHTGQVFDPDLLNAWGLTESTTVVGPPLVNGSPFWVSDNGSGKSTLYNVPPGSNPPTATKNARIVSIPSPDDPSGGGTPTGNAWNPTSRAATCIAPKCTPEFMITGYLFTATTAGTPPVVVAPAPTCSTTPGARPASFLFATEDGTIVGWSSTVFPPTPAGLAACQAAAAAVPVGTVNPNVTPNNTGIIAVDNSARGNGNKGKGKGYGQGAVYKGLAIATDPVGGGTFLYATNFKRGQVEMYDGTFALVDTFADKTAKGYAPFNVVPVTLSGKVELFVTFAVQDKDRHDDVAGAGNGIVQTFDLSGNLLKDFAQGGVLNSPWGVVLAPAGFGDRGGKLWIGNFGDGKINAFDLGGVASNPVNNTTGQPIVIDGLWALSVGNDAPSGGSSQKVYFTAGPNHEADGLFGALSAN